LKGTNTDSGNSHSGAKFKGIENFKLDFDILYDELVETRVIKSDEEIELLRYAAKVSSDAHIHVMQNCHPEMYEYQLESMFQNHCYFHGGCRHCAYTCICASSKNGSILHYGHASEPNKRQIKNGDMMVLDMGAEYFCYASDITRSYPVNGKFTDDQKLIYEAVLAAQKAVLSKMKVGESWPEMHILAERVILEKLKEIGILHGDIQEMISANLSYIFMPHGLGHLLGLATHDVGGYPKGIERSTRPGLKSLRCGRKLEKNMVITVEPGIYFIEHLIQRAITDPTLSKFVNKEKLLHFKDFGGVRIEDDVVVLENGIENLTTVPSSVHEIEEIMKKKH